MIRKSFTPREHNLLITAFVMYMRPLLNMPAVFSHQFTFSALKIGISTKEINQRLFVLKNICYKNMPLKLNLK